MERVKQRRMDLELHKISSASGQILLALALLAAPVRGENLAPAFDQANRLYEQGKYAEAASAYENLLHADSNSPALYFNLGNARFKAGQSGRAIAAYRQAEAKA